MGLRLSPGAPRCRAAGSLVEAEPRAERKGEAGQRGDEPERVEAAAAPDLDKRRGDAEAELRGVDDDRLLVRDQILAAERERERVRLDHGDDGKLARVEPQAQKAARRPEELHQREEELGRHGRVEAADRLRPRHFRQRRRRRVGRGQRREDDEDVTPVHRREAEAVLGPHKQQARQRPACEDDGVQPKLGPDPATLLDALRGELEDEGRAGQRRVRQEQAQREQRRRKPQV
mmetsp:Transcript_10050/g.35483  ORF Transcript_10050/g.35483 Transcript_10050/m.35483 type:complete len:232 (-) Transcript_10050:129-824(-)